MAGGQFYSSTSPVPPYQAVHFVLRSDGIACSLLAASCSVPSVRPVSDETPRTHTHSLVSARIEGKKNNQPKGSGERLSTAAEESFAQSLFDPETHLFCGHTWHQLLPAASGRNSAPLCDSFSLIFTTFPITGSHQKLRNVAPLAQCAFIKHTTDDDDDTDGDGTNDDERDLFIFWRLLQHQHQRSSGTGVLMIFGLSAGGDAHTLGAVRVRTRGLRCGCA